MGRDIDHTEGIKSMKDDTISRQAAIEKAHKLCEGCYLSEHCGKCSPRCYVRKIVKILESVPSAQIDCSYCIANGGDWECDHIHCHIGQSLSSAQPVCEGYVKIPETGIGDLSDGYHTFNGLYEQRMILFAALVKAYKEKAWKSYRHEDGEYCFGGGWFIVGIDTPEGSYTYHYENKYWDMFDCADLPRAKHWDGHTEADAETRLMSLPPVTPKQPWWIPVTPETEPKENGEYLVTRESKGLYRYIDIVKKTNVTDKMASDIVAFMPLPEPWKGRQDEQN